MSTVVVYCRLAAVNLRYWRNFLHVAKYVFRRSFSYGSEVSNSLVPKCPDTSGPILWCRSVLWPKCLVNEVGGSVTFSVFSPNRPGGHTPRPILTQNGSNDVGSRKDVPFGVKIATF